MSTEPMVSIFLIDGPLDGTLKAVSESLTNQDQIEFVVPMDIAPFQTSDQTKVAEVALKCVYRKVRCHSRRFGPFEAWVSVDSKIGNDDACRITSSRWGVSQ